MGAPPQWRQVQPHAAPDGRVVAGSSRKRLLVPILFVAVLLVLTGGGVAAAGYYLGWYGSNRHPSTVVPGTVVSYVQVDLGALSRQPVAWEFFGELPEVQAVAAEGIPDPKLIGWKVLTNTVGGFLAGIDYESEVKPWLGDRFGLAAVPRGDQTAPLIAVQVKDESQARERLQNWVARVGVEVTTRSGYALLTRPDDTAAVLADLEEGTLAQNPTFAEDFGTLADPGVLASWFDLGALVKSVPELSEATPSAPGRMVGALSFTLDTAVLAGTVIGAEGPRPKGTTDVGQLPSSTSMAIGVAGFGEALKQTLSEASPEALAQLNLLGLDADDLGVLFNGKVSIGTVAPGLLGDDGAAGVRIAADDDDLEKTEAALRKAMASMGSEAPIRVKGNVITSSTSRMYQDQLAGDGNRLTYVNSFISAVPDHRRASVVMYYNLFSERTLEGLGGKDYQRFLDSFRSVGIQTVVEGDAPIAWAVRLVRV